MDHIDETIRIIDAAVAEQPAMYVSGDALACIESEVWAELDQSVKEGWRTEEEAQDLFMAWRGTYLAIDRRKHS